MCVCVCVCVCEYDRIVNDRRGYAIYSYICTSSGGRGTEQASARECQGLCRCDACLGL